MKVVTDSIQGLAQVLTSCTPGLKAIESAIGNIADVVSILNQAVVESTLNQLDPRSGMLSNSLIDSIKAATSLLDLVAKHSNSDTSQMILSLVDLPNCINQIAGASISIASQSLDLDTQKCILDQSKNAIDQVMLFLYSLKNLIVHSGKLDTVPTLEQERTKTKTAFNGLICVLEGAAHHFEEYAKLVDKIEELLSSELNKTDAQQQKYTFYSEKLEMAGKALVDCMGDIISKSKTPDQFKTYAESICRMCLELHELLGNTHASVEDEAVKVNLSSSSRDLYVTCIKMIDSMRLASGKSSADQTTRSNLLHSGREVSMKVAALFAAVKEGSKSLLVCQGALSSVLELISDLESTFIFAQAGQLDPVDPTDNFNKHKDSLLSMAKIFTGNAKEFISVIVGTHEELAVLAQKSITSLENLCNQVTVAATSISSADKNMQQSILSSCRNVCESFQGVLNEAINVIGNSPDKETEAYENMIKIQFGAIVELVNTIKSLGDESSRGIRAIETTVGEIDNFLSQLLDVNLPAQGTALPNEIVNLSKLLATGAAALVSSNGKSKNLVASSNLIKKCIEDLCRSGKAAVENAPEEHKKLLLDCIINASNSTQALLRLKKSQENGYPIPKQELQESAKNVAIAVSSIVNAASSLIPEGYVDEHDPNVVAERELLQAALDIEAAAKKLSSLKAPTSSISKSNMELNFEAQIIDSAKSIAAATAALVRSATAVQREIVSQGKNVTTTEEMYHSDGTWIDGLVSASKTVSDAMQDLCQTADDAVKGLVKRDRVTVSAKGVASSTVLLLTAATVRADPKSQNQIKLKAAGKSVINATTRLVKAAEEAMAFDETDAMTQALSSEKGPTLAKVQEMEAQMSILKMESELERARNKLASVRKGKYGAGLTRN